MASEPTEPIELPSLHTALLDEATLGDLFRDLSLGSQVLEIRVKSHAARHVATEPWTLAAARQALAQGTVNGVQIRYALGPDVWCDTLMRTTEGTRLVRINVSAAAQ